MNTLIQIGLAMIGLSVAFVVAWWVLAIVFTLGYALVEWVRNLNDKHK